MLGALKEAMKANAPVAIVAQKPAEAEAANATPGRHGLNASSEVMRPG